MKKLNRSKLDDMIANENQENAVNVIKFYSDTCPMCIHLRDYYIDISRKFSGINNANTLLKGIIFVFSI